MGLQFQPIKSLVVETTESSHLDLQPRGRKSTLVMVNLLKPQSLHTVPYLFQNVIPPILPGQFHQTWKKFMSLQGSFKLHHGSRLVTSCLPFSVFQKSLHCLDHDSQESQEHAVESQSLTRLGFLLLLISTYKIVGIIFGPPI